MTMAFDPQMFGSGAGGLFGGLFGNSGSPYQKAMEQYQNYGNQGQATQQPFLDAGKGAIGDFQNWLSSQKNPSEFINNLMGQYQQSPYEQYQQQQSLRAGKNSASASGLSGSTPLMDFLQQNSQDISSKDMNQWLQNVLGINTQYGEGEKNLMSGGQSSANSLTDMFNQLGQNMGQGAYGKESGKKNDLFNSLGGIGSMFLSFL